MVLMCGAMASLDEFGNFDMRFYRAKPSLMNLIRDYLRNNLDSFVFLI
jgi:hypothetical protein